MNKQYKVIISYIPIFADNNYSQTSPDFFKILLNNNSIIKKEVGIFNNSIEDCLYNIYIECINFDYNWTTKELADCRKIDDTIEITYVSRMPYIKNCNKNGEIVNIDNFLSIFTDEYYVRIITGSGAGTFR